MPDIDPISLEIVDDGGQSVNMNLHLSGDYYSLQAEAWAVGQKNGVDVPATDPTYHNNAKYYALAAQHAVGAPIINETAGPGDIVTFDDGADDLPLEQLKVSMAPVQDLHGYDKPWVGGAGKNLCYMTLAKLIEWNTDGTWEGNVYTRRGATFTVNTDSDGNIEEIVVNGTPTDTAWLIVSNEPFTLSEDCKFNGLPSVGSSNTFQFRLQPNTINIRENDVSISAGEYESLSFGIYASYTANNFVIKPMIYRATETDTSYAPYSNICPITGWDGVEVSRTGKNVFDTDVAQLTSNTNITVEGETQSKNNRSATVGYIRLKPETNYTISYSGATNNGVFYYKADKTFISYVSWEPSGRVFETPAETAYARFSFAESNPPSNIQVEEGSTATAYEDSAQTYSITFPSSAGTVYGGTLTINRDGSGSLVVDKVDKEIPTITAFSTTGDYGNGAYVDFTETLESGQAKVIAISDVVEGRAFNNRTNFCCAKSTSNSKRMIVYTNADYTVEQYNANIAGGHLVANLATPVSYSLTANQVRTLLGYNAIWADAGQVTVIYPADTKLYIDNLNQPATGVSF